MFIEAAKKGEAAENAFYFKLHSELGPVYRLKMPGKFKGRVQGEQSMIHCQQWVERGGSFQPIMSYVQLA